MKITAIVKIDCPSGFYCKKNGKNKCNRLNESDKFKKPYCEVFYPFLDTDRHGNVIKCEDCLLTEREARVEE